MKTKNALILLLIFVQSNIYAQTGNITGVLLADSSAVVPYVKVSIENTTFYTISNGEGMFYFNSVPVGEYQLFVKSSNYITQRQKVIVKPNQTTKIEIVLTEKTSLLPEVAVGVNSQQKLLNAPGSVSVISQKEMETFGYSDINKTLKAVPGVNLQEEDGFGLRPNIGLRGTGVERSSKITVMEDGILMSPAPYIAPSAYYFPTIGRMQGVEIYKGSSQIKYGPYTTGGAINLISTQIPNQLKGKFDITMGSFGSQTLHAYVGDSKANYGYLIETFQYGAKGFTTLPNNGNTGFNKSDYLAKLRFNTSQSTKIYQQITFKAGRATEDSKETYLGLTQNDFNNNPFQRYSAAQNDKMNTVQHQYSAIHLIKFSKRLNLTSSVYYSDFKRNWYKLDKVADSSNNKVKIGKILDDENTYLSYYNILKGNSSNTNNTLYLKANNRIYYARGVQSVLSYKTAAKSVFHKVDFGLRLHQDQIDRFQWIDDYIMDNGTMKLINKGQPGTESNRIETANALASYINYKLSYKKITVTSGLRYENIQMYRLDYGKNDVNRTGEDLKQRSNFVEVFVPGLAVNYKITPNWVGFAGVHKGFAPPGTKTGTKPEESINYELGSRYNKKSLLIDVVVFYNAYKNLLGVDLQAVGGDGNNELFNGGRVKTNGVEFKASYDILSFKKKSKINVPITVVYTYTDATFLSDFDSDFGGWGTVSAGDKYPYLSNHQTTVIAGLEHKRFNVYTNFNYKSKMFTEPTQFENSENIIPSYYTIDISVNYFINSSVNLFASVNNLTNQIYIVAKRPAGLRPGMPRAFYFGVRVRF